MLKVRAIPGYADYFADRAGRIFSTKKGRPMYERKQNTSGRYPRTVLSINGRRKELYTHRLICLAFYGLPPSPSHLVRHLNGDKHDNRARNLAWGTPRENNADQVFHGTAYFQSELHRQRSRIRQQQNGQFNARDIMEIRRLRFKRGWTVRRIAKAFEVSVALIYDILTGRLYSHLVTEEKTPKVAVASR